MIKTLTAKAALCFFMLSLCTGCAPASRERVVISIPQSEYIQNIRTNYYKEWLEEQTGLSIEFNIVHKPLTAGYLRAMFESGYVKSDAFFSILDGDDLTDCNAVLQEFGEKGYIISLNAYVAQAKHLNAVCEKFPDYRLRDSMTSPNGNIYYMPGFDPSISESNYQVLWLNKDWLKNLKLAKPQTTEDLYNVLLAFRTQDPNGNGEADEIPLAGSRDIASEQCYNAIINAFVYNDPENSRLFVKNGKVLFAPMTDNWRQALKYLRRLYAAQLISPLQFRMEHDGLEMIANDPRNILGGFTSKSITDVIFYDNPEIRHNFVHIAPLAGPGGTRNATIRTPFPKPAGVITSSCKNPEAVFKLFDLMLSEEAFLIGRYGEKGVDWMPGSNTDTDSYNKKAAVRVINHLWNTTQNKHLCETGPFFAYPQYADSVTFSDLEANQAYINTRAYHVYEERQPQEYLKTVLLNNISPAELKDSRKSIDNYTGEWLRKFIAGEKNPFDDNDWSLYLKAYNTMGVQNLIDTVQKEYDASEK